MSLISRIILENVNKLKCVVGRECGRVESSEWRKINKINTTVRIKSEKKRWMIAARTWVSNWDGARAIRGTRSIWTSRKESTRISRKLLRLPSKTSGTPGAKPPPVPQPYVPPSTNQKGNTKHITHLVLHLNPIF